MPLAARPEDSIVTLKDGRALGFAAYGDPDGYVVFSCHGGLSSRSDIAGASEAAVAAGVRIVAPDRPGVGLSDRKPGRALLDWPDDVAELADHLGAERFGVLGWSLGGQYALSCGYSLGGRVDRVALVASGIPREWPGMIENINSMDRDFMAMSRNAVTAAGEKAAFTAMRETAAHAPKMFARMSARDMSDASAEVLLSMPEGFARSTVEGLAHPAGVVDEYKVLDSPWGFDLAQIAVPVRLWQGDDDRFVPPDWATRLADAITTLELVSVPGEGHFLAHAHYPEIIQWLRDGA